MIRFTGAELVACAGVAELRAPAAPALTGVSTDTRALPEGALFVALSGPNFDGNSFAMEAARRGARAVCLRGTPEELAPRVAELPVEVGVYASIDPRRVLSDLASFHRSRLAIPVVGITGSCGKTTTKNILLELLAPLRRVVASPNSFNNDIGVPHTLFLADEETEVLVVEMGTNHPGEIAALCRTARPEGGIITNIGASHLEGLLSEEGVATEKGELAACLPSRGFCVLNADCRFMPRLAAMTGARVLTFSVDGAGDLDARNVWFHAGGTTFELRGREVTSPLLGLHNVQNLLAALAACEGLGFALDDVLPQVSRLSGGRRRLELKQLGALAVFDDTYNANPESAKASVRVLAGMHGYGRRVLVLGDMLELGERAAELHHAVGELVAKCELDLCLLVGELTRATAAGALEGGLAREAIVHWTGVEDARRELPALLRDGDLVLVKGSRRVGLERLVADLEARYAREGVR
ncbi:MAG: UDP-N-acetylmuramoyl-tripeptide--D-alanyl-D-alanine ligase [Planctomycetes bacterium]|nr:UDP-N-acetylmuramoyl-tripeptide--D-alanyl-D-alanine ligase [Planctomycetota bacterium]